MQCWRNVECRVATMTPELTLLTAMLETESHSGQEQALASLLCRTMREWGIASHIDAAGNAVGIRENGPGPTLLLLGHMDTVAGHVPVRQVDGMLYGRGAVDAKGPLAAFICAARRYTGPGRVVVVGAVEEESATSRGAREVTRTWDPDCAIIGEPSAWDRVTVGYKGRLLVRYDVARPVAHTASQRQSACEAAIAFWQAVAMHCAQCNAVRQGGEFERVSSSLRAMDSSTDGLTERATMNLGFRLPSGFAAEELMRAIEACAVEASVRFSGFEPAIRTPKNTEPARALVGAIRQHGGDPRYVVKTGTSDLNVVAAHWNCPMVAYGPGDSSLDHTPDEHIDLEEYLRSIEVLVTALHQLGTDMQPRRHAGAPGEIRRMAAANVGG